MIRTVSVGGKCTPEVRSREGGDIVRNAVVAFEERGGRVLEAEADLSVWLSGDDDRIASSVLPLGATTLSSFGKCIRALPPNAPTFEG